MTHTLVGKHPRRKSLSKRGERGAAVFVVVLVVMLLTSLGLFAVKSATISNRASGYNRQLTQTHYVADLAVVTTLADLNSTLHDAHDILENRPPTGSQTKCEAMGADTDGDMTPDQQHPKCMLLSYADLNLVTGSPLFRPPVVNVTHGSLGKGNLSPNVWVEITDPYDTAPPAGYQLAGGAEDTQQQVFSIVTVSVTGLTQPQAAWGTFTDASGTSAGFERQRARVRMGPVMAQK